MTRVISTVLFDFDGTIFDASRAICASYKKALEAYGYPPCEECVIRDMIGRPLVNMFEHTCPDADKKRIQELVDVYRDAFLPLSVSHTRPMPYLNDMLEAIAPERQLAIVTSRTARGAKEIIQAFGIGHYFKSIIGVDSVQQAKPHPEGILRTLKEFGIPVSAAAMVGDTTHDILAAKAAGVLAIGVHAEEEKRAKLQEAGANYVVSTLQDVAEIVCK